MSQMSIAELVPNIFTGTIPISGTLSQEIDLGGYSKFGLYYSGATNGTISFQVADKRDADGGTYVPLIGTNGSAVTIGPSGASGAVSTTVMEALSAYRFVKIAMSNTQSGVVTFRLPAKP